MHDEISVPVFRSAAEPVLADLLRSGAVGVLLTDTVYGIVGSALDPLVAGRVMAIKGRQYKPGTLIAADTRQLIDLGLSLSDIAVVERYWPGPVSASLSAGPPLEYLHLGKNSLVARIPDNPALISLLELTGPLITTSANRPDEPNIRTIAEAQEIFGNDMDFYVDGGLLDNPIASTIIRVNGGVVEVLRQGVVSIDQ